MAMLAEPRKRKRYNLVPRGKALYEDEERFGTKMLEKMGWSKGKGLGANEDGSKDFVRVRYKNDAEGFGFEERDDQWTQHEEGFDGLLKSLNGNNGGGGDETDGNNASETEMRTVGFGFSMPAEEQKKKRTKLKDKISGHSLEEKSKLSKARVHYKKFTRGKDLSRYSEKDLANIFGKKPVDEIEAEVKISGPVIGQPLENEPKQKESSSGELYTSAGISVGDYFKQKMEARKRLLNGGKNETDEGPLGDSTKEKVEVPKKKQKKAKKLEVEDEAEVLNLNGIESEQHDEGTKKKTKKRKLKEERLKKTEAVEDPAAEIGLNENTSEPAKKKKKDKLKTKEIEQRVIDIESANDQAGTPAPKQKKAKKQKSEKTSGLVAEEIPDPVHLDKKASKKKKGKKQRYEELTEDQDSQTQIDAEATDPKEKKKKKNKQPDPILQETQDADSGKKSKRKTNEAQDQTIAKYKAKPANIASPAPLHGAPVIAKDSAIAVPEVDNVYTISSFCAEKFRNADIDKFFGSNLSDITGYGITDDVQLEVKVIKGDEDRITQLWNCTRSKYNNAEPKHSYHRYIKQVRAAKKAKQKLPTMHVKTWKRKNAFQGLS